MGFRTETLDKAIVLNLKDACVYNNRGVAYYEKGEVNRAIEDYTRAIELNAEDATAYYNRGEAWLHLQEWGTVRSDLTTAKKLGADIIASFGKEYESVSDFEGKTGIRLPPDIAEMLTQ